MNPIFFLAGACSGPPERAAQVRAVPAEPADLHPAVPADGHHRHHVLLRPLHVRIPKVHGIRRDRVTETQVLPVHTLLFSI